MARPKIIIKLTGPQVRYLASALFELGEAFGSERYEYMFKMLTKILTKAKKTADSEDNFYLEKAYFKSCVKLKN